MTYPYTVYKAVVEDHIFWVAKCPALSGCVGQGDTLEEALSELEANEAEWLATAKECGVDIPAVPVVQESMPSGKFTVRVSSAVHQAAINCAHRFGVSLNQYVNDAIVSYNAQNTTVAAIKVWVGGFYGFSISHSNALSNGHYAPVKPLVPSMIN